MIKTAYTLKSVYAYIMLLLRATTVVPYLNPYPKSRGVERKNHSNKAPTQGPIIGGTQILRTGTNSRGRRERPVLVGCVGSPSRTTTKNNAAAPPRHADVLAPLSLHKGVPHPLRATPPHELAVAPLSPPLLQPERRSIRRILCGRRSATTTIKLHPKLQSKLAQVPPPRPWGTPPSTVASWGSRATTRNRATRTCGACSHHRLPSSTPSYKRAAPSLLLHAAE